MTGFLDIASTSSVQAVQHANGSDEFCARLRGTRAFDHFTQLEAQFITQHDSFYMATVSETGWPYVQHRGGPAGFLRVLDDQTLGFADFRGNRQYISVGNLSADDRVCLMLMDYTHSRSLKIYAHTEARDLGADQALADRLAIPDYAAKPERALLLHLEAFDWNCSQHITPRFSAAELERALLPVRQRMEQLESENGTLRQMLAATNKQ